MAALPTDLPLSLGERILERRRAQDRQHEISEQRAVEQVVLDWMRAWSQMPLSPIESPESLERLKIPTAHARALREVLPSHPMGKALLEEHSLDDFDPQQQRAFRPTLIALVQDPRLVLGPEAHSVIHLNQALEIYSPYQIKETLTQGDPDVLRALPARLNVVMSATALATSRATELPIVDARVIAQRIDRVTRATVSDATRDLDPKHNLGETHLKLFELVVRNAAQEVASNIPTTTPAFKIRPEALGLLKNRRGEPFSLDELRKKFDQANYTKTSILSRKVRA